MRKSLKIALALAVFPAVVFASPTLNIGVCRNFDNLSNNDIKMVADGVFLDSEGNRVEPCKHGDSILFPIVETPENGKRIYNESRAKAMKQDKEQPAPEPKKEVKPVKEEKPEKEIKQTPKKEVESPVTNEAEIEPAEGETDVPVTYGDGKYDVQDVNDFREQVRQEELRAKQVVPSEEYGIPAADIIKEVNLPPDIHLSIMLQNLTENEKKAKLVEDFQDIAENIKQIYQPTLRDRSNSAAEVLAANNRIFLADGQTSIINQYRLQGDYNGAAYAVFNAKMSTLDFLRGYMDYVTKIATSAENSLDVRLAQMEFLHEQVPEVLAGRYAARQMIAVEKLYGEPQKLSAEGYGLYQRADESRRQLFMETMSKANEAIMQREYDALPDKLTKDQYSSLSNLDKYKYAPVTKGNYVDHSQYQKRPREKVINVVIATH